MQFSASRVGLLILAIKKRNAHCRNLLLEGRARHSSLLIYLSSPPSSKPSSLSPLSFSLSLFHFGPFEFGMPSSSFHCHCYSFTRSAATAIPSDAMRRHATPAGLPSGKSRGRSRSRTRGLPTADKQTIERAASSSILISCQTR